MKETHEKRIKRGIAFEPDVLSALLKVAKSQFKGDVSEALNHTLRKALKIPETTPAPKTLEMFQ
jgi:CBS domain containing-hemolysin-like protein